MKIRIKKKRLLFFVVVLLLLILLSIKASAKEKNKDRLISMGDFKITYYCSCDECSEGWGARTSTGNYCEEGKTVAVDPSVIAYGTRILIDDKEYVADDCGGGVEGDHIDIYIEDHDLVEKFGIKYKKVWLVK